MSSVAPAASSAASVISGAAFGYVQQVTGTSTSKGSQASVLEEATETSATTAKEAAKGDRIAIKLIAKQQAQKALENPPANESAKEPGKGDLVDQKA